MGGVVGGADRKLGSLEHPFGDSLGKECLSASKHSILKAVAVGREDPSHVAKRWLSHCRIAVLLCKLTSRYPARSGQDWGPGLAITHLASMKRSVFSSQPLVFDS